MLFNDILISLLYTPFLWYLFISNYQIIIQYTLTLFYLPIIIPILHNKYSPLEIWNLIKNKPYGTHVFNILIGFKSPYSYSIHPKFIRFNKSICKKLETKFPNFFGEIALYRFKKY